MGNYYTLGAALPVLSLDAKIPVELTPEEFLGTLRPLLSKGDERLLEMVLLKRDNDILVRILEERSVPEVAPVKLAIGREKLAELTKGVKKELEKPEWLPDFGEKKAYNPKDYPAYMVDFVQEYLQESPEERAGKGFVADRISARYRKYIEQKGNNFLKVWNRLELSISAIFAAVAVRDFDLDGKIYLIGESELLDLLRSGNWKELSHLKEADMIAEILQISEDRDLVQRERRIDALKWKVLDSFTFSDHFSINAMLAYLLRLEILERWALLDEDKGATTFRRIISTLNEEGKEELEEYRRMAEQSGALRKRSLR